MSRAANTLTTSDVLTTPIKLKYSTTYDSSSYAGAGITVLSGKNSVLQASEISPQQQRILNYRSVRHLFYSNYLTGSFPVSSSYAFNWEQSTAGVGTGDEDIRTFPTASNSRVKILSIPREIFGEKISRKSFQLISADSVSYRIVDDGNGNLIDIASDERYVDTDYFTPQESTTTGYVSGRARGTRVGNILYAQGLIIITNEDYYNILDAGPIVIDQVVTFFDTDNPKNFNPLTGAEADSSPIVTASLQLIPIPGEQFPSYTIVTASVILSPSDPLFTTIGNYSINFSVSSSIGTPSNIGNIALNIIPNCPFTATAQPYFKYNQPTLLFDFSNSLRYGNSGSVIRDLSGNLNNGTSSLGTGSGSPINLTNQYTTTPPGYYNFPGTATPTAGWSIKIPNSFKFPGTTAFSLAAWVYYEGPGATGTTPGIVAAEGLSGGNPIGWAWYFDDTAGIKFSRYDGSGGSDQATLTWNALGSPTSPLYPLGAPIINTWLFLTITYSGTTMEIRGFKPYTTTVVTATAASTISVGTSAQYSAFVGQRIGQFPEMRVGYLTAYSTVLAPSDIVTLFTATKNRYGY